MTSHDDLVDSSAISIGNLEVHTNTVDMFVVQVGKRAITQSGLHQILVMFTVEMYMPAVRQSNGNVVIVEELTQRHDPVRSKPRDKNVGFLQEM